MNILIAGETITHHSKVHGMQVFNVFLLNLLKEMGHNVHFAITDGAYRKIEITKSNINVPVFSLPIRCSIARAKPNDFLFVNKYDLLIISDAHIDYSRILKEAQCRVIVISHGHRATPLLGFDGIDFHLPNVKYVVIDELSLIEAESRGVPAVHMNMPIQFEPKKIKKSNGKCIAIGSLVPRKRWDRVANIAEALKKKCMCYGAATDSEVVQFVTNNPWLEYGGTIPHEELLDKIAESDFLIHMSDAEGRVTAGLEAVGLGVHCILPKGKQYEEWATDEMATFVDIMAPLESQLVDIDKYLNSRYRRGLRDTAHQVYGLDIYKSFLDELISQ